ncbi:response regulator transcription factor [Shouchella miscanthi]|uniref:response regulator transcription factor n=1 Tax=Shouchella miscanthi TaxID=2598861 RepID=UPI001643F5E6|nr:response regulator [Shouchella miscanthi]
MSIRMLIVDDEPVICQGLVQTIPWESLGVQEVDMAFNGKQALEKLAHQPFDLILTDISMPEMDGLALAEHIVHEKPDTKMIIISGFDHFDYARQALRLGIEDYLLKPVDVDELMALVKRVTNKIVAHKERKNSLLQDWMAQQLRHRLFHAPLSEQIKEKNEPWTGRFRLLINEVSGYAYLQNTLPSEAFEGVQEEVRHVVEKTCSAYGMEHVSLYGHENELLTLVYSDHSDMLEGGKLREIWEDIMEQSPYPIHAVSSSIGQSLSGCYDHYQEGLGLLDIVRGQGCGLLIESREHERVTVDWKSHSLCLWEALLKGDESQLEACINQTVTKLLDKGQSFSQMVEACQSLEEELKRKLQERLPTKSFDRVALRLQEELDLRKWNTSNVIEQLFLCDLIHLLGELKEDGQNNWMIEKMKRYIHKHYQHDLRAAEVAERHFITPNYFSMLFKKETGQSFSEYVNGLRIQKSVELLLNTSNKVFEIAEYVGYKEYKYFVQVFKKQVGFTPTQYRRMNATQERREKQIES